MPATYATTTVSIVDITSGTLPSTKTHKARRWAFVPAADPTAVHLGTLTVCQGRELATYIVGVSEEPTEVYFARQDGEPEVYAVRVMDGRPAGCSCKGFRFAGTCKHADATAAAVLPLLTGR